MFCPNEWYECYHSGGREESLGTVIMSESFTEQVTSVKCSVEGRTGTKL